MNIKEILKCMMLIISIICLMLLGFYLDILALEFKLWLLGK